MTIASTRASIRCVPAILLLLTGSSADAQSTVAVPEEVSCAACGLELQRILSLGEVSGPGIIGEPNSIVRNSRGWYFVSHQAGWNWFSVFDARGKFVRQIGREGEGPGEFSFIRMLRIGPGDTLVAVDNGLGRLTKYSPDLDLLGVLPFTYDPFDFELLRGGQMLVNTNIATRDQIGFPLHFLDDRARITSSFGTDRPVYRSDLPGLTRRSLAVRANGSFWAVHFSDYVMELWGPDGSLIRRFSREFDWFPPHGGRASVELERAPLPNIVDAKVDEGDRL